MRKKSCILLFSYILLYSHFVLAQEVYKEFWPSGHIKSEEPMMDGKREGLAIYHHDNGRLYGEIPWKNGQKEGQFKLYRENGSLEQEFSYKNGQLDGRSRWYDEQGRLKQENNYINGLLEGEGLWYNPDGSVMARAMYHNDQMVSHSGSVVSKRSYRSRSPSDDSVRRTITFVVSIFLAIVLHGIARKKKNVQAANSHSMSSVFSSAGSLSNIPPEKRLQQLYQATLLTWLCIIGTVFIFGLLIFAQYGNKDLAGVSVGSGKMDMLRNIFLCVAAVFVLLSQKTGDIILNKGTDINNALKKDLNEEMGKLLSSSVVKLVMCEVPALLGFILSMSSHNIKDYYLLAAFSVVGFMLNFPRYEQWENWLRQRIPGVSL